MKNQPEIDELRHVMETRRALMDSVRRNLNELRFLIMEARDLQRICQANKKPIDWLNHS